MCMYNTQTPTPHLEHTPSSAGLPAITNDLLKQLVFAVYLSHIQDMSPLLEEPQSSV